MTHFEMILDSPAPQIQLWLSLEELMKITLASCVIVCPRLLIVDRTLRGTIIFILFGCFKIFIEKHKDRSRKQWNKPMLVLIQQVDKQTTTCIIKTSHNWSSVEFESIFDYKALITHPNFIVDWNHTSFEIFVLTQLFGGVTAVPFSHFAQT